MQVISQPIGIKKVQKIDTTMPLPHKKYPSFPSMQKQRVSNPKKKSDSLFISEEAKELFLQFNQ